MLGPSVRPNKPEKQIWGGASIQGWLKATQKLFGTLTPSDYIRRTAMICLTAWTREFSSTIGPYGHRRPKASVRGGLH